MVDASAKRRCCRSVRFELSSGSFSATCVFAFKLPYGVRCRNPQDSNFVQGQEYTVGYRYADEDEDEDEDEYSVGMSTCTLCKMKRQGFQTRFSAVVGPLSNCTGKLQK